ncbi:major outer capsid protein [Broome reovirus]|uniref:Major outer capsid protein n=1 Tax=Broome reovirus TaxID=667093 RepID=A9UL21_9REOV|nr:major outer capsid protein [Broome reovirus]AAY54284.1 major outer capsid protein sigma 2 [Broome reovirus]ACU68607.1 major outer capsid protein [Broome reovirus]
MEVRPLHLHCVAEGIYQSYDDLIPNYSTIEGWAGIGQYVPPEVIRVGRAYVCTQCGGMLYYDRPDERDYYFPHHVCHQRYDRFNSPFQLLVRTARVTALLKRRTAVMLREGMNAVLNANGQSGKDILTDDVSTNTKVTLTGDSGKTGEVEWSDVNISGALIGGMETDPDFWQRPIDELMSNGHVIQPAARIRHLFEVFGDVMKKKEVFYTLGVPCNYSSANVDHFLGSSAYDLAESKFSVNINMQPRSYLLPVDDSKVLQWPFGTKDASKAFSARPINIAPLVGNVSLLLNTTDSARGELTIRMDTSRKMRYFREFLTRIYDGWHRNHLAVVVPNGIACAQSLMEREIYHYLKSPGDIACERQVSHKLFITGLSGVKKIAAYQFKDA